MNAADDELRVPLRDPSATARLAERTAALLEPGFVLFLSGDLGSGKTTFVRALLRALGYPGRVKSPSFSLLESYDFSSFRLYHFDFYRLTSGRDWLDAGFEEYIGPPGVAVIEWPERAGDSLPPADLRLRLSFDADAGDEARIAYLSARTARGHACLKELQRALAGGS